MNSSVLLLARRFLLSKASDGFLSFISGVSIIGVTLGVMALTVVTSVINGFENELVRVITSMNGEILVYSRGEPLKDPDAISKEIQKTAPEIQDISPAFVTELMVSGPSSVSGAVLEGVQPESIGKVTKIPERIIKGRFPLNDNEVVLGSALAEKIGITDIDEQTEVRLIAPFAGELDSQPKALKVRVVGIFKIGMYDYDSKFLVMNLKSVQTFLNQEGKVTTFVLKLKPGAHLHLASDRLTERFAYPFRVKDWTQLNKNLFYAIKLEKAVIAVILTVIVLVAAFNVVSTLMMMIHDKTKEIAILKAIGLLRMQSFGLFCVIGTGIGAIGVCLGILSGLGMGWFIEKTHFIKLPADIYYIGFLPVIVRWKEIAIIGVAALFVSFLATVYPSWKVARRSPLDGLRYE